MNHPLPETPITVIQLQRYIRRYGIDCTKDSRQIMGAMEAHFGCRIKLANMVLACLWQGYAIIPHDYGDVFRFVQVEA